MVLNLGGVYLCSQLCFERICKFLGCIVIRIRDNNVGKLTVFWWLSIP